MNAPITLSGSTVVVDRRGATLTEPAPADLILGPGDDPRRFTRAVSSASVIEIDFPTLRDGRGYTHAHRLRALGFTGTLRAVGDVGVDQLHYLLRSGFDEFQLPPDAPLDAARRALARFAHFYEGVRVRAAASFVG